ncbi:MAG: TadE/TadG family type IV pilus assembly protein [Bdellovibrionota bacterium]
MFGRSIPKEMRLSSERGNAFSEFIITAPFLVFMFIGIIDLGTALNKYLTVNRIAYEGTRYAASVPLLETAAVSTAVDAVNKPGHQLVRQRIDLLLARNGLNPADFPADYLKTERLNGAANGFDADQVRVTLNVPFTTFFPFLSGVLPKLNSQISGPYLFV